LALESPAWTRGSEGAADPKRLRQLRPDLDEGVLDTLERGLSLDRGARFPNARAMYDAWATGPVALPDELGRWISRLCTNDIRQDRSLPPGSAAATRTVAGRLGTRATRWSAVALALGLAVTGVAVARLPAETPPPAPEPVVRRVTAPVTLEPSPEPAPAAAPPAPPVSAAPVVSALAPTPAAVVAPVPARPRRVSGPSPAVAGKAKVRVGYLTADATPWAAIFLGDRELVQTPVSRYPLPVGEHLLTFRNPALKTQTQRRVRISEGKVSSVLVDLTR
jgi:hypothetical protein